MQLTGKIPSSVALGIVLLITLWAGLKPKGYRFRNDATWIQHHCGIAFGPIGIAYTKDSLEWTRQNSSDSGFSIELSVTANKMQNNHIANILGFWDVSSHGALTIGQWRNHLLIFARDAHAPQKYQIFGANTTLKAGEKKLIQIVSGQSETDIYVNGIRTGDVLSSSIVPNSGFHGRLILGNSETAGDPWLGELYGIALYKRKLLSEEITLRFHQWDSTGRTSLPQVIRAAHFFRFNETGGSVAHDCLSSGFDLQIPKYFHIIKKQVLVGPWDDFRWDKAYLADVIINLFGFIPLGFFLSLFLFEITAITSLKKNLLFTIIICFIISLSIELIQVYIPTRSSQLSDLFLNTLGGAIGGMLTRQLRTRKLSNCP
jgi:VanZ like family/Concanavalin A-like lectin/glucanases superfamily